MAMKKIDTQEAIALTLKKGVEKTEHPGIDVSEDEFTIIQPFDDLDAVIVIIESSIGGCPVNIKVADTMIILERQEGILGVLK